MRQKRVFILIVAGLALILAACGSGAPESTAVPGGDISGYSDLVDALAAEGATVDPAGEVEQPFFSVKGQAIKVNSADVQVFEYDDVAAREAESSQISADGSSIGTSMVSWIDQPNFWAQGRLIVLYVGTDEGMLDLLTSVLGQPLTSA
jgi:hypothetical protein